MCGKKTQKHQNFWGTSSVDFSTDGEDASPPPPPLSTPVFIVYTPGRFRSDPQAQCHISPPLLPPASIRPQRTSVSCHPVRPRRPLRATSVGSRLLNGRADGRRQTGDGRRRRRRAASAPRDDIMQQAATAALCRNAARAARATSGERLWKCM